MVGRVWPRHRHRGRPLNLIVRPQQNVATGTAICAVCGKVHPLEQIELSYQRPDEIWSLPKGERGKRTKESDDLCALWDKSGDDHRYFVRSVLPLRIEGSERPYRIGIWVELAEKDFHRVVELWSDPEQHREPAFHGTL